MMIKKYEDEYEIFIGDQLIDLNNIYLNKDNIERVELKKPLKKIKISQIKKSKFTRIDELELTIDSLYVNSDTIDKHEISVVIIDGIVISDSLKKLTKIETNAIKNLSIIKYNSKLNSTLFCRRPKGEILVVEIK